MKVFTQNIDTLERMAGIPAEKIIEAHGSFASHHCIECKSGYPEPKMKDAIEQRFVPRCNEPGCNGLVKPDIVFFGEALPTAFHHNKSIPTGADLCIVMGTSLTVQPFASLPDFCPEGVPRLLINLERVGSLGSRPDDVLFLGECDVGVQKLARALGWQNELESLRSATMSDMNYVMASEDRDSVHDGESLNLQVAKLSEEVSRSLKISDRHADILRNHLHDKYKVWLSSASDTVKDSNNVAGKPERLTHSNQTSRISVRSSSLKSISEHDREILDVSQNLR